MQGNGEMISPDGSAVEVMIPVTVVNEFLFAVFTAVNGWPEVTDLGRLADRAERTERRVHVTCLVPYRTIIDPLNHLHGISPGKRSANRMSGFFEDQHTESCKQIIQEPYPGIAVPDSGTLADDHIPVGFLLRSDWFPHRTERSLLKPETDCLECPEQVLIDLLCQFVAVFRRKVLDFLTKIPFHLLDILWGMTEYKVCYLRSEIPAGCCGLEIATFARNLCTDFFALTVILSEKGESGHGTGFYLRISDFPPGEYSLLQTDRIQPESFYILLSHDYSW
jgi:hypothetical protein